MNPTHQALIQILGDSIKDIQILDYSIAEDFEKLWKFEGLADRILIIWGRTAPDGKLWPIDASACVSPLDWAAAYARHHFPEKPKHPKDAQWPQIMILDADPAAHASVPTLAHFHTLRPDQLPWLTVPKEPGLSDVCKWLASTTKHVDQTTQDALTRFLRGIRHGLTSGTTDGEIDRHSVFNLVAPLILNLGGARTGSCRSTDHAQALFKLLYSTDATLQNGDFQDLRDKLPSLDSRLSQHFPIGIRFVLVDDQAEHGWSEWVQWTSDKLLPGSNCQYKTTPEFLLDRIDEALGKRAKGASDARFLLHLFTDEAPEVLLLDLRLFNSQSGAIEERFYERLLQFCRMFQDQSGPDDPKPPFAWPGFSKEELDRVEEWYQLDAHEKAEREHGSFIEAVSLLARLIALVDPTLPVIIFSSTGRADIVKRFEKYGSIISEFSKPHDLSRSAFEIINEAHDLFQRAVLRTLPILRLRMWHESSKQRAESIFKLRPELTINDESIVEIYIDESGKSLNPPFTVGGILLVYPSEKSIYELTARLKEEGLVWGLDETFDYRLGTSLFKLPRRDERLSGDPYQQPIDAVRDVLNKLNIQVAGIAIQVKGHPDLMLPRGMEGLDEELTDLRYFKMLTDLLECSLFGLVRAKACKTSVGINIATKTGSISTEDEHDARSRYGLRVAYRNGNEITFYSVLPESVLPTAASALSAHLQSDLKISLTRLKTCSLADYDTLQMERQNNPYLYENRLAGKVGEFPRQIHYMADWMSRFGNVKKYETEVPNTAKEWFSKGIHQRQGQGSAFTVLALRAADMGNWRVALRMLRKAEEFEYEIKPNHSISPAVDFVLPRIPDWSSKLSGTDLWGLAEDLLE